MNFLLARRSTIASRRERRARFGRGRDQPAPGDDAGYTLIEMLVVLALTAVITGLMATSLGNLRKIRAMDDQLQQQTQLDAVAALIASDLRAAVDVPLLSSEPGRQMHFEGSTHEMTFVALVRTGFRSRGLRQVRYRIREAEDRRDLIRETVPYRFAASEDGDEVMVEMLLPDVLELSLSWQGEDFSWKPMWEAERRMPVGARLRLHVVPAATIEMNLKFESRT